MTEGESERVDFKRAPEGVSADDLVAFANSEGNGHILVGVDEIACDGAQVGVVRGCDVSDQTILQILNKAVSCIPPVSVDIFIENLNEKPILRLLINSSATKPHCTPKGVYCRRDGSRTRPLHPNELLKIFLENESRAFAERFESAAERITRDLTNLESTLDRSIQSMADQLGWADYQLGDTESLLQTLASSVSGLRTETNDIASRMRSIFRQDKREDPVREREYKKLLQELVEEIGQNAEMVHEIVRGGDPSVKVTVKGKPALELTQSDLQQAFIEAAYEVRVREDLKRYKTVCKPSGTVSKADMAVFVELIRAGSSIADIKLQVEGASALGFVKYDRHIVGTAALVDANSSFRDHLFEAANSGIDSSIFVFELKWVSLHPQHRQKGQLTGLLKKLLPRAKSRGLFAVAERTNDFLQEVLPQHGFRAVGEVFKQPDSRNEVSQLFIRAPTSAVKGI